MAVLVNWSSSIANNRFRNRRKHPYEKTFHQQKDCEGPDHRFDLFPASDSAKIELFHDHHVKAK